MGEVFLGTESSNETVLLAPQVTLAGLPLATLSGVSEPEACSARCRSNPECLAFNYCQEEGTICLGASNTTLSFHECQLLSSDCTLVPEVEARGGEADAQFAGFPIRSGTPPALPGFVVRPAQGLAGSDIPCNNTIVPGACGFASMLDAVAACTNALDDRCRSIVVLANGTDGCSGPVALLKSANLGPSNAFLAPTVYVLEKLDTPTSSYAMYSDADVTLLEPSDEEAAAPPAPAHSLTEAALAAGSDAGGGGAPAPWLGCVVAADAVAGGDVVGRVAGVQGAEACCRECRARGSACNGWNYCGAGEGQGCCFSDFSVDVDLDPGECELRYQSLADPSQGAPPYLLARGAAVASFTAGFPLAASGPELPGFRRYLGAALFGQPGYACNGTLKPALGECVLSGSLEDLAQRCAADGACAALVYRPGGALGSGVPLGVLRGATGANLSLMVYSPASVVYAKEGAHSDDSGGGLSAGAAAGIAAGCAAAVAAAAAGATLLLRRRRRRRGGGARVVSPAAAAAIEEKELEKGDSSQTGHSEAPPPELPPGASLPTATAAAAPLGAAAAAVEEPAFVSRGSRRARREGPRPPVLVSRPVAASPFAAMRASRVVAAPPPPPFGAAASDGAAPGAAGGGGPGPVLGSTSRPPSPAQTSNERDLLAVMSQVMHHREREDSGTLLGAVEALSGIPPLPGGSSSGSGSGGGDAAAAPPGGATLPASLQAWLIPPGELQYLRRDGGELAVLGEGASARVLQAVYRGEPVAAKQVAVGRGAAPLRALLEEAQRMAALRHPHLVTFYGVSLDGGRGSGALVMELCEGRDLGGVLPLRDSRGQRLFGWRRHGLRIAWEVATALNYLHAQGVVHLDVKSSNVLLSARGVAKLGDVGLARLQTRTFLSDLPQMVGTFAWVAPEVLMSQPCTQSVDIFSFSVLLWEIITGERPVRGHQRQPLVPQECSQDAVDLMTECSALNPAARPSAQQVMQRLHAMLAASRSARSGAGDDDS